MVDAAEGEKMNKTNIEWAEYTWNPVTGCLHGCEYCYAKALAETRNRKGKVIPKIEWIEEIKEYCFINDIPYFEKNSLQGIVNRPLIQQMPEGLK